MQRISHKPLSRKGRFFTYQIDSEPQQRTGEMEESSHTDNISRLTASSPIRHQDHLLLMGNIFSYPWPWEISQKESRQHSCPQGAYWLFFFFFFENKQIMHWLVKYHGVLWKVTGPESRGNPWEGDIPPTTWTRRRRTWGDVDGEHHRQVELSAGPMKQKET